MIYIGSFLLLFIGIYGVITKKNLIKIIIGMVLIEYASRIFIVALGYKTGGIAPIITKGDAAGTVYVNPLPQAMIITSIVIGLAVLILMASLAIRIYEKYGTADTTQIRRLRG